MSKRSVDSYRFHYTYRIEHPSGLYYCGVHSSDDPYNNKYMGSGVDLKAAYKRFPKKEWRKIIVEVFDKRFQAEWFEAVTLDDKMLHDPNCLNKIKGFRR